MSDPIPFNDLTRINEPLRPQFVRALDRVLDSSMYLRGSETAEFEGEWADRCGQGYAVTCNSGTDALTLAAVALGLVTAATPANTLPLTATGLAAGGTQVRVVEVTQDGRMAHMAADSVPVLLFGRLPSHQESAATLVDAAHAHGWRPPTHVTATWSFYPTKTLGALGDAGAVTTNDAGAAQYMRELRGADDRLHDARQLTSRMDEVQAAFLRIKLPHLDRWLADRARVATRYDDALAPLGVTLDGPSLNHLYVIRVKDRDQVRRRLSAAGIQSKVHWAQSLDQLPGPWTSPDGDYVQAHGWAQQVLSLPCYPGLTDQEIDRICSEVTQAVTDAPDDLRWSSGASLS